MQRCRANEKIFKCDADSAGCLLALDSTHQLSNFERDRIERQVATQVIGKCSPPLPVGIGLTDRGMARLPS
jgi:hypothetical protein